MITQKGDNVMKPWIVTEAQALAVPGRVVIGCLLLTMRLAHLGYRARDNWNVCFPRPCQYMDFDMQEGQFWQQARRLKNVSNDFHTIIKSDKAFGSS